MTENRFDLTDHPKNLIFDFNIGEPLTQKQVINLLNELHTENKTLKKQIESEHTMLDNAILLERTRMGKNSLIQYREAIQ